MRLLRPIVLFACASILVASGCGGHAGPGGGPGGGGSGGMGGSGAGGMGGSGGAGVLCGDQTCAPGRVCVVQVDTTIHRFCADDLCAPMPLACDCASPVLSNEGCGFDDYCVSATNGQVSCMAYPDAGTDQ